MAIQGASGRRCRARLGLVSAIICNYNSIISWKWGWRPDTAKTARSASTKRNRTGLGWVKGRILLPRSAQGGMSSPQGQRGHQKNKTSPQIPGQGHFLAGNSSQPAVPQSLSSPGSRLDFISAFRGAIAPINSAARPGERLCL